MVLFASRGHNHVLYSSLTLLGLRLCQLESMLTQSLREQEIQDPLRVRKVFPLSEADYACHQRVYWMLTKHYISAH